MRKRERERRNNPLYKHKPPANRNKRYRGTEIILDRFSLSQLKDRKKKNNALIKYHWNLYRELAIQRDEIKEQINEILYETTERNFQINRWQRAVKYKYCLHPFSCVGSIKVSGRFNYGEDIGSNFNSFHALYIASNKDTALQETLGQKTPTKGSKLTARELALTNPQSETIVSVNGKLDAVFDLNNSRSLTKFVNLIKRFKLSAELKAEAKALGGNPLIIRYPKPLFDSIMDNNWKQDNIFFDTPSNGQIFGHILYEAGINGILYNSKLTKKKCLAIFPATFENSDCYIKIDDDLPDKKIPSYINSVNYKLTTLTAKEVSCILG